MKRSLNNIFLSAHSLFDDVEQAMLFFHLKTKSFRMYRMHGRMEKPMKIAKQMWGGGRLQQRKMQ